MIENLSMMRTKHNHLHHLLGTSATDAPLSGSSVTQGRVPVLVAMLVVVLSGCGSAPSATTLPESPAPRPVRVVAAAETRVARSVSATGTLAAQDEVILGTKVVGRLSEITVDLGSLVRRGQAIARIDPDDYRLRVEQAEAALGQARARLGLPPDGASDRIDPLTTGVVRQATALLDEARLTHDRMVQLWERQLIARAAVDAARANLTVAEGRAQDAVEEVHNRQAMLAQRRAELAIARQQLADTVIAAPLDGAVTHKHASVGEYVAAGAPVVTLVRLHPLRLQLLVPEREAAAMRIGQTVRLTVEGDANTYSGRVARLSPTIATDNRTLLVEAEVPNEHGVLRPGSFAKADIVVEADQKIVTVPAGAIVTFAGIEKVLMVADGTIIETRVRTGRHVDNQVEITEGVTVGAVVVVDPGTLVSGQPVTVVN